VSHGLQRLQITGGAAHYDLFEPPPEFDGHNPNGYFSISYSSPAPVDLLAMGDTIRFVVEASKNMNLSVELTANGGAMGSFSIQPEAGTQTIDFPFDAIDSFDFGAIEGLKIRDGRITPEASLTFHSITVIPEPATSATFVAAFCALWIGARRLRGRKKHRKE